jgi:ankyrin repeat protein
MLGFAGCSLAFLQELAKNSRYLDTNQKLSHAAMGGNLPEVKRMLGRGADPNFEDIWTPLQAAVQNRNRPMIRLLLERGADPHRRTYSYPAPLDEARKAVAAGEKVQDIVRLLENAATHRTVPGPVPGG